MKICFATVLYKEAEKFLEEFLESVAAQSYKDFDLVIINDNYDLDYLNRKLKELYRGRCVVTDCSDKKLDPPMLRVELLTAVKAAGYELAILGDADDTFTSNRVRNVVEAFENDSADTVYFYNMLTSSLGPDILKVIPEEVSDFKVIAQGNFLGMGNTAIRMSALSEEFIDSLHAGKTTYFDWYLFTRITAEIGKGVYVPDGATIYRQHAQNVLGDPTAKTSLEVLPELRREQEIKLHQYELLGQVNPWFKDLRIKLKELYIDDLYEPHDNVEGYWLNRIHID